MDLAELRRKIDDIDVRILQLVNDRVELALRTRRLKPGTTDEARERQVIQGVLDYAGSYPLNHLPRDFYERLYGELIGASKRLQDQEAQFIGFQGEHGAHGDVAARAYDASLVSVPCIEFSDVLHGVQEGLLDVGIVPVENSLEGAVTQVNDLLFETKLKIVGELQVPVHHCLLTLTDRELRDARVVYSHPQALAQCRAFIERHGLEPRPFFNTAGAAKMLSEQRPEAAAVIANQICESIYNLNVVERDIEDHQSNSTRFVVLSRDGFEGQGNKCSITFAARHEAGSLLRVLKIFAEAGIDLTRIASRPLRGDLRNYSFFLDFVGSSGSDAVQAVLAQVERETVQYLFLGCYPAWDERNSAE